MPSAFETAFAGNLSGLYAQFGLPATYSAPDGSTIQGITAIVHREPARQVERESRTTGELQTAEIRLQQSQVPKAVKGARVTVEGVEIWTIETTPVLKNGQQYCTCTRTGTERLMDRRARDNA